MALTLQEILGGLTMAEHMGDVNDYLPMLCEVLNLPNPKWSDRYSHYVMAWDEEEYIQDLVASGEDPEEVREELYHLSW